MFRDSPHRLVWCQHSCCKALVVGLDFCGAGTLAGGSFKFPGSLGMWWTAAALGCEMDCCNELTPKPNCQLLIASCWSCKNARLAGQTKLSENTSRFNFQ